MSDTLNIRVPLEWLPAGLITWYEPEHQPVALATSWMSLICGGHPRVRAGWPGLLDAVAHAWPGGDFILNIPDEHCLPLIKHFIASGTYCLNVLTDLGQDVAPGFHVDAPRLLGCTVQLECRNGEMLFDGFGPEVVGDVVLLHRMGQLFDPLQVDNLCALNPLNPNPPRAALQ